MACHEYRLITEFVTVWGTGSPRREFLAVDDLVNACVFVMKNYSDVGFLNIGGAKETTIADFARLIAEIVGYRGQITFLPARWYRYIDDIGFFARTHKQYSPDVGG
jgi:GDP-L-fucose synthase